MARGANAHFRRARLFCAQRHDGVDMHGAACRQVRRREHDRRENAHGRAEHERIEGAHRVPPEMSEIGRELAPEAVLDEIEAQQEARAEEKSP